MFHHSQMSLNSHHFLMFHLNLNFPNFPMSHLSHEYLNFPRFPMYLKSPRFH
jgi:hypothetical protein